MLMILPCRELLRLVLVGATLLILAASTDQHVATLPPITLPGCIDKCGNISIPFPFGMKKTGCFLPGFEVTCNDTFTPPRLFLGTYPQRGPNCHEFDESNYSATEKGQPLHPGSYEFLPMELMNISLTEGVARAYGPVSSDCSLNETYHLLKRRMTYVMDPFLVSTRNVLTAIGWSFEAKLAKSLRGSGYLKSCSVRLYGPESATNGSCMGGGCCQAALTENITNIAVSFVYMQQNSSMWGLLPLPVTMAWWWRKIGTTSLHRTSISTTFPRSTRGVSRS